MSTTISAPVPLPAVDANPPRRTYEIVALQVPISYNRHGDHDHDGLIFALAANRTILQTLGGKDDQGNDHFKPDEPHPLVRPLVLRACVGETLDVHLTNHLRGRRVGLHLVGGGYQVTTDDGAHVGGNPDTTLPPHTGCDNDDAPSRTYRWHCANEGVFVFHDGANLGGTEADTHLRGLFGVLIVEPAGTVWRDSTGQDATLSSAGPVDGLYVDVMPADRVTVPPGEREPWLGPAVKEFDQAAAFREYVIVFHDQPAIVNHTHLVNVKPPWGAEADDEGHGGHGAGVSHVMPVSYRAEPMANREKIIWSRLTGQPIIPGHTAPPKLEVPVVNEEQHHSSWLFGDPATPILRAYLGDPVRIRLVHCGVKETHVFHLHLYEWYADAANPRSPLIDAITISPQTGHTIEPLWGAGNRQRVPGDVIWHCHLYPHFHHGMWGLFRTYDRLHDLPVPTEPGPHAPWTPVGPARPAEQCYPDGTPIPRLLVLPDREAPPPPSGPLDGWPRFMVETRTGAALPADPLDRAGRPGEKSPRVPWIEPGEIPDGFDYRPATQAETDYFLQHQGAVAVPGTRRNTDPRQGWLAPYFAFGEPTSPRPRHDLEVLREPFRYNRHRWHDPRGHRFRLAEPGATDVPDDAALRAGAATNIPAPAHGEEGGQSPHHGPTADAPTAGWDADLAVAVAAGAAPDHGAVAGAAPDHGGAAAAPDHGAEGPLPDPWSTREPLPREPLYFRVHHGDAVELTLHNRIAYPIAGDEYDHALPRPGVPGLWECGLHVHMVKFDVVTADGAASGWNYLSGPRPGYRMDYKWWADEEFGVIFTHDHFFANYRQKRGLFGAMLVEPKGTVWLDPQDPTRTIIAGEQAIIVRDDGRAFRELALGVQDFVPLWNEVEALNPPETPTSDGDQGSMGVSYRSAPLRERLGDPADWFATDPTGEPHDHAAAQRGEREAGHHHDPETPLLLTYPGEPIWIRLVQGSHEEQHSFTINGLRWRRFRDDPASPVRSQQTIGISEAFTFTINDDGTVPYGPGDYLWRFAGIDDTWLGCWGLIRAVDPTPQQTLPSLVAAVDAHGGVYQAPPALAITAPPVRQYAVRARQRRLAYRPDLIDRFGLVYEVTAMTAPTGETVEFAKTPDDAAPQPLVLRCRAGERLEITLHNTLPAAPPPLNVEPFAPAVPIDEAAADRRVSHRVSLHADLVRLDVRTSDGANVGRNPDTTVAPNLKRTYTWLADLAPGPVPLYDLADVRNHRHHGLIGALIVEPAAATPLHPADRDATVVPPFARQAWTGPQAVVRTVTPAGESALAEEVVLLLQDGLRFFVEDNLAFPFPDIPADPGEEEADPEDQGQKAINYQSDPTGPTRWLTGLPPRAAHFTVPAHAALTVHLVGGFDKPRNHSFTLHGLAWPEWPHRGAASPIHSSEGGLTVNAVRSLVVTTGEPGDVALRSGVVQHAVSEGLWALLSVVDKGETGGPA